MRRKTRITALVLLILALIVNGGIRGVSSAEPAEGTDFVIGVQSFVNSLDPQEISSNVGQQVTYNIFDTLVFRDPYKTPLEIKAGLADSWKRLDELTWEFQLRKGVKFHDGSELTAEDVVFSLMRAIKVEDPRYGNTNAVIGGNMDRVEAVDKNTVRVITLKPDPIVEQLLSDANAGIVSKAYVEKVGLEKSCLMPIGTGPYKVSSFVPGNKLVMERFEDFWGDKAPFKTVTYTVIPEIASRITSLVNKETDFIN